MTQRLLKNYKIKNIIAFCFALFVFLGSAVNSYIDYKVNKKILYDSIDGKLKDAALSTNLILGESFFDRATEKGSISDKEDWENIIKLSKLANNLKVEYVYAMVQRDGKIYFITSSATDEELRDKKNLTRYFDYYDEATDVLKNVLKTNKITFEESTDKWGTFRSIFIPFETKKGNRYIIGADMEIDYIKQMLRNSLLKTVGIQLLILVILIILGYLFIRVSKKELKEIMSIKNQLDKTIEEKTQELENLNSSLEQRVKEEVEKNRQKEQFILRQSKLAQMGEMLSMIAHQWRQPLAAIAATSNSIYLKARSNKLDNEKAMTLSLKISQYTQHLSSTINDFRNFFQTNKDKELVSLKSIVQDALNIVEASLKNQNIQIETTYHSDEEINTYKNELKQVVLNIIKNAEDALTEQDIKDPKIEIEVHKTKITIKDNAKGIPPEIMDRIFEPYFSTKNQKDGTGLGLYMSKVIIEEHCKGKLCAQSTSSGAIFTIEL